MNAPIQIVLIEDSEDDYILAKEALSDGLNEGAYVLQWFDQTPNVSEFLKQYDPDVILIDYSLGEINGVEFASQIRERDACVSLILLTGLSDQVFREIDQQVEGVGISDFLTKKEVNGATLARSVRYAYENAIQRRQLQEQAATIEDILQRTEMVMWSESHFSEGACECYFSDSIQRLTGYSKKEFMSRRMRLLDLVVESDRERVRQAYEQAVDGEIKLKYRIQCGDNRKRWVEETRETLGSPHDGNGLNVVGCLRDITREVESESMQHLMAKSLDQSSDAILITEANLERPGPKILYVNKAICRMSGYTASELLGETPRIFQGPKTDRRVLDKLRMKLAVNEAFQGMTTNYRKDGSEYIVSWRISPVMDQAGKVTHYVSTQTDVTQEIRQRERLNEQENFLREIGSMAKVGGWRYLKSSRLVYWTDPIYEIHAMPHGSSLTIDEMLSLYSKQDQKKLKCAWDQCMETGTPYGLTLEVRDRRGQVKWCRTEGAPIWSNGEITGVWGVYQDVTETRLHSVELEQALKAANYANESKNQFLMMMSHELRTPLNPIMGFAELMLSDTTNAEHCAYLKQIQFSASHLVKLISEILDIASIESGRMKLDSQALSVSATVNEVIEMFHPQALEKGLTLRYINQADASSGIPLICMGDASKIRQILINLLNNAIKFTEQGEVCVELLPPIFNGDKVGFTLKVVDSGIGISSEQMGHIFNCFYQVDQGAARKYDGRGIGLNLCRELAELMGGTITVSSELGKGSTFTFKLSLPRVLTVQSEASPIVRPLASVSKQAKVLVVEDDAMNRLVISELLQSMNVVHELATDGYEALDLLSRDTFCLVLMDIQMPKLNGIEATRRIRAASDQNSKVRIVALSAHVVDDIKKEAIDAGMDDFLEKPVTLSKLKTFFDQSFFEEPEV
ncbi:response regulator [Coraliomargarita sp. SDUM461004]|uniref:histidine kinase n=1 Tax=Thalassobacterium sedimentorum TaxID=3041258 RepID=A0ABU1AL61_9BACT|nr:response regulator [Coraliomargarita sp. SDUM461004]MDQ8195542.1 response regulator [Coraliomargarita sp. SDUM461004]